MLVSLSIRDVVLVDRLDLTFRPGLSALTGETGAGKSILLDALGLALGARAEGRLVRHGADRATVAAIFRLPPGHPSHRLIDDHGLPAGEDELVLRRVVQADGRSRAFINDQSVGVGLLRRIGAELVEIHGQFDTHRLMDPASHRDLLDAYGNVAETVAAVRTARDQWRRATEARLEAEAALAAAVRDEDYLRHAVAELDELRPESGEEAALAERRAGLRTAEKLHGALEEAAAALSGGAGGRSGGVTGGLRAAIRALERVAAGAGGRLDSVLTALDRAATEATEAEAQLDRVSRELDLNTGTLEQLEERLFALRALARKHRTAVDDLAALRDSLAVRLEAIDDGSEALRRLKEAEAEARLRYCEAAGRLSEERRGAAAPLDEAVAAELGPLRLGRAVFRTRVAPHGPDGDERSWTDSGWDQVAFEVATNPGTPPGPLDRIASGGELSRFMLALKVVLARADPVPTLIFDEVDAGIGGAVAAAVGDRLARLADAVQVLVVTHSPQVAARGHVHWRVSKAVGADGARTSVDELDPGDRREEIARMLAGATVTEEARAAAESLLATARAPALEISGG